MAKKKVTETVASNRFKKSARYRSFRLEKRKYSQLPALTSPGKLLRRSIAFINNNRVVLLSHSLIFILAYGILVQGLGSLVNLSELRSELIETRGQDSVQASFSLLGELFNTTNIQASNASAYQLFLLVIFALSTFWLIRAIKSKERPIKSLEAYYFGPSQIVPFIIVLVFIFLQLLPIVIADIIVNSAQNSDLISTTAERMSVLFLAGLLVLLSLYFISSSIFSLIIVSLAGTKPWQAIRSSSQLVMHRRWQITRYILIGLIFVSLAFGLVMVPSLIFLTTIAEYIFYLSLVLSLLFGQIYLYELYRELIK